VVLTVLQPEAFDAEGFLRSLDDWSPEVAHQIASGEGIELGDAD